MTYVEICLFLYIIKNIVNHNNGGFMKKLAFLFIIILLIFSYNKNEDVMVFSYQKEEVYDNYYIKFKDCDLNTNNFIYKLEFLNDYDFKILQIVPYNNIDSEFLFYSNDLEYVHSKFKNDYINLMIEDSKYTTNICIKEIKINTSNYVLDKLNTKINFTY